MAIIYVRSSAAGGGTGADWTNAYTTLQAAFTAWTTSDIIWCAADHNETATANVNWTCGNATLLIPCPVYRVDHTTDIYSPTTGADTKQMDCSTGSYDIVTQASFAFYGLYFDCGDDFYNITNDTYTYMEDCKIQMSFTGNSSFQMWQNTAKVGFRAKNTTFSFQGTGGYIDHTNIRVEYDGCTFTGTTRSAGFIYYLSSKPMYAVFTDCDFSGISTTTLVDTSNSGTGLNAHIEFRNCKFPTSYSLDDGTINSRNVEIVAYNCHTAGDTFDNSKVTVAGDTTTSTSAYHDSGYADYDGTTNISGELTPSANCSVVLPIQSFKIGGIATATGSQTFTLEMVENYTSALTAQECWLDLYYLDSATSVVHKVDTSSREFALASYTALSAGTGLANWTGEPAGSRSVKIAVTVTVNQTGLYFGVLNVGKYEAGKVVHVDNKMSVA